MATAAKPRSRAARACTNPARRRPPTYSWPVTPNGTAPGFLIEAVAGIILAERLQELSQ
jgi:hypothetical protein